MTDALSFQTRARTIDHLGREQIADVPTAISELWKNAYDAYARSVDLHIFEHGPTDVALICDDGHGMSLQQFVSKWLVVGTSSKVGSDNQGMEDRLGLPLRPRQGQKGIGRLSVAAIASSVLIVSKSFDNPYIAALVDWRLFENPFILLQDVRIPVIEFSSPEELRTRLEDMKFTVLENLDGSAGPPDRRERISSAWQALDTAEAADAGTNATTSSQIYDSVSAHSIPLECLQNWPLWIGQTTTGTALLLSDINSALSAWIRGKPQYDSDESEAIRASLVRTLTGFSDPYADNDGTSMNYRVVVHDRTGEHQVLGREDDYGASFLEGLEHSVLGRFDEFGVFRGKVRAFGRDLGEIELTPTSPPPTAAREIVGPFAISIATYEVEPRSSALPPEIHQAVHSRAETHSGLSMYRDGLRVMPYGRPENDFFKIEERRGYHAGREFWASRRMFGRLAITRTENPNLRDKAGREGLIDNTASRAMQMLVIDLLRTAARRYFGAASQLRGEMLPAIQAENEAAAKKAKAAGRSQLNTFRSIVRDGEDPLNELLNSTQDLMQQVEAAIAQTDGDALWSLAGRIEKAARQRAELKLPPKPKMLGTFEDRYRSYRDAFSQASSSLTTIQELWNSGMQTLRAKPPAEVARSRLSSNQKALTDRLAQWRRESGELLRAEHARLDQMLAANGGEFYKAASPLVADVESGRSSLATILDEMDEIRERLGEEHRSYYEPYIRALSQLSSGVDLDGAFAYAGAHSETLERKLEQIQSLAQVGISVEILGHELQSLDGQMSASMEAMPASIHQTPPFLQLDAARRELVERLRFLSQLQVSGRDLRRQISGEEIYDYLNRFFVSFEERGIDLSASDEFKKSTLTEYPSRIFPVFINLVNNAIHWISGSRTKAIRIDRQGSSMVIGDSGPGIDSDDLPHLFELFFTRRLRGRGVGLYLCQQTLAAGGHTISYVTTPQEKVLGGANFKITLRNGFDA